MNSKVVLLKNEVGQLFFVTKMGRTLIVTNGDEKSTGNNITVAFNLEEDVQTFEDIKSAAIEEPNYFLRNIVVSTEVKELFSKDILLKQVYEYIQNGSIDNELLKEIELIADDYNNAPSSVWEDTMLEDRGELRRLFDSYYDEFEDPYIVNPKLLEVIEILKEI